MSLVALVRDLRAEARRTNERRLVVLHGSREACYERAAAVFAASGVDRGKAVLVGERDVLPVERVAPDRTEALLGMTTGTAVFDAHDRCSPNALGRVVGTVDGGGLMVLLAPPLGEWPNRRDGFDASLAVFPYDATAVSGAFRRRLVSLLRTHPGIEIVNADSGAVERKGLTDPAPRLPARRSRGPLSKAPGPTTPTGPMEEGSTRLDPGTGIKPGEPDESDELDDRTESGDRAREPFPEAVYERCLTDDQARCVRAFERLGTRGSPTDRTAEWSPVAIVAEADRGRGKSSAAGLAAGALAANGREVCVTAPSYRASAELFARAAGVLSDLGRTVMTDDEAAPRSLDVGRRDDRSGDQGTDGDVGGGGDGGISVANGGSIRYLPPAATADLVASDHGSGSGSGSGPDSGSGFGGGGGSDIDGDSGVDSSGPDVVFVDEAAGLPVSLLRRLLAAERIAFTTTVHGYEGAGRGFATRFRESLAASDHDLYEVRLDDPIRYAAGDPIEVWLFRTLLLDARPPVASLVADARPEAVAYERLSTADLLADGQLLRECFGLLVAAHYRTEPNDLARLLDAPNLAARALSYRGHVVSVCLLAREGGLPAARRREIYDGARIAGHMLPDLLTSQLRDEQAGGPRGLRVLRIATHEACRSRGLGSLLLDRVHAELDGEPEETERVAGTARASPTRGSENAEDVASESAGNDRSEDGCDGDSDSDDSKRLGPADWLGAGYGATPQLIDFWRRNDFRTVHVSTTRNERSGENSAVMLRALTDRGRDLAARHARWFVRRFPAVLSDALSGLDPDVARGALRAAGASVDPDLSAHDWGVVRGAAHGSGLYDTDPAPFRRLALAYFTDLALADSALADPEGSDSDSERAGLDRSSADADPDDSDDKGESNTVLSTREERLLVCRVFQARPAERVAARLGYESERQCLRALGDAYAMLVSRYDDEATRAERNRDGT